MRSWKNLRGYSEISAYHWWECDCQGNKWDVVWLRGESQEVACEVVGTQEVGFAFTTHNFCYLGWDSSPFSQFSFCSNTSFKELSPFYWAFGSSLSCKSSSLTSLFTFPFFLLFLFRSLLYPCERRKNWLSKKGVGIDTFHFQDSMKSPLIFISKINKYIYIYIYTSYNICWIIIFSLIGNNYILIERTLHCLVSKLQSSKKREKYKTLFPSYILPKIKIGH